MGGAVTEVNLALLMLKRARVVGSTLRARPIGEKAAVMDGLQRNVWPDIPTRYSSDYRSRNADSADGRCSRFNGV